MCGIVAYLGKKPAQPILLEGLKRLEYRGYDSVARRTVAPLVSVASDIKRHLIRNRKPVLRMESLGLSKVEGTMDETRTFG